MNKSSKDTLAILVSGSITILNTGDEAIYPGMRVAWQADEGTGRKRKNGEGSWPEGRPRDKALFKIVPAEKLPATSMDDFRRLAFERVIGVALTGALPGQQFDIMIGGSR